MSVRTLQLGVLQIVEGFAGSIVSEMAGRGRGGVGGNTACATAGGIGDDGSAGEYPHKTWLGTCVTKQAAGLVTVKNCKDWITKS